MHKTDTTAYIEERVNKKGNQTSKNEVIFYVRNADAKSINDQIYILGKN